MIKEGKEQNIKSGLNPPVWEIYLNLTISLSELCEMFLMYRALGNWILCDESDFNW